MGYLNSVLSSSSQVHAEDAPRRQARWKGKGAPRKRGKKRERKKKKIKKKRCVENCGAKFRERVSDITYFKEILERLIYRGYSVFFFF
jgi:hypothetical protein